MATPRLGVGWEACPEGSAMVQCSPEKQPGDEGGRVAVASTSPKSQKPSGSTTLPPRLLSREK